MPCVPPPLDPPLGGGEPLTESIERSCPLAPVGKPGSPTGMMVLSLPIHVGHTACFQQKIFQITKYHAHIP